MELIGTRRETPIPFQTASVQRVALVDLSVALNGIDDQVIQFSLRGSRPDGVVEIAQLSPVPVTQFVECHKGDILIRGYYAIGRTVFLCGSSGLRNLLVDPVTLNWLVETLRRRRNPETGVAKVADSSHGAS